MRRRSAASASRARVCCFSLTSSVWRAASHSCGETIGGVCMGRISCRGVTTGLHITAWGATFRLRLDLPEPALEDLLESRRVAGRERVQQAPLVGHVLGEGVVDYAPARVGQPDDAAAAVAVVRAAGGEAGAPPPGPARAGLA